MMDSQALSNLSSLKGEFRPEDFIQPHYKEVYRLAIDHLVRGGRDTYQEFLKGERVGSFLSDDEQLFITANAQTPLAVEQAEDVRQGPSDSHSSSGTYWPLHSDVVTPDLVLGWPQVMHERLQTSVDLLHHPPRHNSPPIKEVIRKHIQDARQVIAIVMDMFTDIDIFKETVDAAGRGVPVYVLLDELNLKSFLAMAENQDIKIPQLRNMRVRVVRGHEYLSQSGAKFHGAMKQNFLLVDCKTAIYGSYSFMWSFEKIHLSMVQVITGHLVKSYDEEFRTLYARSTVPEQLCPLPGLSKDLPNGRPGFTSYVTNSCKTFERKNHLRHSLDAAYLKSCERQVTMKLPEDRLYEEPNEHMLLNDYKLGGFNPTPQLNPVEMSNYLKRHSYAAGDRQNSSHILQNVKHGSSNWNIPRDTCSPQESNFFPMMDDFSQMPYMCRGQDMRPSYNVNDKHLLSVQQYMPTLENTSKSFMRTWRIESYLKNPETSFPEAFDQYESPDTDPNSSLQSRMRSSLVFNNAIPEHLENRGYVSPARHYSSMQWVMTDEEDKRRNFEEFKMKSLQMLDNTRDNVCYNTGKITQHSIYASLGRPNGGKVMKSPDILTDEWNKRHSVADPRNNSELRSPYESPGHMYGVPFPGRHTERGPERVSTQYGHYGSNLNEDRRSVSHYDVKNMADIQKPPSWQEPPCRTVSAAALDGESKGTPFRSKETTQHDFLKKSSRKIRSLLNIPEKKEALHSQSVEQVSLKSGTSTDTLTAEDEGQRSQIFLGRDPQRSAIHPNRISSDVPQSRLTRSFGKPSSPRFNIEEHRQTSPTALGPSRMSPQNMLSDARLRAMYDTANLRKDPLVESQQISKFESRRASERKPLSHPEPSGLAQAPSEERGKGSAMKKASVMNEHRPSRVSLGPHENKLGKLIQKWIHKK